MLTLKLVNTRDNAVTIVETSSVKVHLINGGKRVDCEGGPYVIDGGKYDVAYVENARGSTVQVIKP